MGFSLEKFPTLYIYIVCTSPSKGSTVKFSILVNGISTGFFLLAAGFYVRGICCLWLLWKL